MAKIKINLVCNGVDYSKKSKDRTYYLPLEMTGGVKIYVSYELGMKLKDIIDKEKQYHDKITKCLIPGKKGKLIVCEHSCEKCPFRYDPDDPELSKNPSPLDYDQFQQRLPLNFSELADEEGNEFEPASDEDFVTDIYYQERKEKGRTCRRFGMGHSRKCNKRASGASEPCSYAPQTRYSGI